MRQRGGLWETWQGTGRAGTLVGGGLGCLRAGEMGVSRPLNPPLLPSMLTNTQCLQNNNAKVKK